jgi:hypothetical protein
MTSRGFVYDVEPFLLRELPFKVECFTANLARITSKSMAIKSD